MENNFSFNVEILNKGKLKYLLVLVFDNFELYRSTPYLNFILKQLK